MEKFKEAIKSVLMNGKKLGMPIEATFIPIVINIKEMGPEGLMILTNDSVREIALSCDETPHNMRRAVDSARIIAMNGDKNLIESIGINKDSIYSVAYDIAIERMTEEMTANGIVLPAMNQTLFHERTGLFDEIEEIQDNVSQGFSVLKR
jgi:hypothetical protein